MKATLSEVVELKGDRWSPEYLAKLKEMNPQGRVAVTDDKGQTFIACVSNLEAKGGETVE